MTRKQAREQAFALVFEQSFHTQPAEETLALAAEARDQQTDAYIEAVVTGVDAHFGELDDIIARNLRGWALGRLSRVCLSALRVAIYEILHMPEIPLSVSINEAVELAKQFGGEDDWSYVNGVLSSVAKALFPEGDTEPPAAAAQTSGEDAAQ